MLRKSVSPPLPPHPTQPVTPGKFLGLGFSGWTSPQEALNINLEVQVPQACVHLGPLSLDPLPPHPVPTFPEPNSAKCWK
jgi:hypothetical protein